MGRALIPVKVWLPETVFFGNRGRALDAPYLQAGELHAMGCPGFGTVLEGNL